MYFVSKLLIHHVLTMHMIMYHICSCTCMPQPPNRQTKSYPTNCARTISLKGETTQNNDALFLESQALKLLGFQGVYRYFHTIR